MATQPDDWQLADAALLLSFFGCQGIHHGWLARDRRWWRSHHLQWLDPKKNCNNTMDWIWQKKIRFELDVLNWPCGLCHHQNFPLASQCLRLSQNAKTLLTVDAVIHAACKTTNAFIVPLTLWPRRPRQTPQACYWRIE